MKIYLHLLLLMICLWGLGSCSKSSQQIVTPPDPVDSIVGQYIGIYNSIEIEGASIYSYTKGYDTFLKKYTVVFSIVKNGKDSFQITGKNFSPNSYVYNASNSYETIYLWPANILITPATGVFHMYGGFFYYSGGSGASWWISDTINAIKVK